MSTVNSEINIKTVNSAVFTLQQGQTISYMRIYSSILQLAFMISLINKTIKHD